MRHKTWDPNINLMTVKGDQDWDNTLDGFKHRFRGVVGVGGTGVYDLKCRDVFGQGGGKRYFSGRIATYGEIGYGIIVVSAHVCGYTDDRNDGGDTFRAQVTDVQKYEFINAGGGASHINYTIEPEEGVNNTTFNVGSGFCRFNVTRCDSAFTIFWTYTNDCATGSGPAYG